MQKQKKSKEVNDIEKRTIIQKISENNRVFVQSNEVDNSRGAHERWGDTENSSERGLKCRVKVNIQKQMAFPYPNSKDWNVK